MWSAFQARKIAAGARYSALPLIALLTLLTAAMAWLLV
jgi:hypothetical protein